MNNISMCAIVLLISACNGRVSPDTGGQTETDSETDTDVPPMDTGPFDRDEDGVLAAVDCDDMDPLVGAASRHYPDLDGDGYGDQDGERTVVCPGPGLAAENTDCDDAAADTWPGAPEVWCDSVDQDCGVLDDAQEARLDGVLYPVAQDAFDAAADGATIELCHSDYGLVIDRPVHVVGVGDYVLVSSGIQIVGDGEVTLTGLVCGIGEDVLVDGRPVGGCLAVLGAADVVVESSELKSPFNEGMVYVGGSATVTVRSSELGRSDSSVVVADGVLVVEDSTFADTSGDDFDGGAISSSGELTLTRVTFTNSTTKGNGGAIFYTGPGATLTDVTFTGNHADGMGGAVSSSGPIELTRVTFEGNTATAGGGALHHEESTLTLTEVDFLGNSTDGNGGGALLAGPLNTLVDVAFDGNTAVGDGGGVWASAGMTTVSGGIFTGNSAVDGGAIALDGEGSWFGGTSDANTASGYGGGISAVGTWTIADFASVGDDGATGDAVGISAGSTITMADSELQGIAGGRVLYVHDSVLSASGLEVTGPANAGIYLTVNADAQLEDCTIDAVDGDGLYIISDATATATNSVFSNNGTGVLLRNVDGISFTSVSSTFTGNLIDVEPLFGDPFTPVDGTFTCDQDACYE